MPLFIALSSVQIHNSLAPRSTRTRRCCCCENARGLHLRRGERLLLPSAPPLYADVLARQAPAVLLVPTQRWACEVPGSQGRVWLDARGVARCRHGHSRAAVERQRSRGGCGCTPAGLRVKRQNTARRRSRAAGVPLSALAASVLLSRAADEA